MISDSQGHSIGLNSSSGISTGVMTPPRVLTVQDSLFKNGPEYDFFQAVSLLESIYPDRQKVGMIGRGDPVVRFAANSSSNSFAASSIFDIRPASTRNPVAKMTVGFLGLTGPSGILPQHYTELLRRIEFEARGPQKFALRDWFDLFNDRVIALFYRSWKKYRPYATHLQALTQREPDDFSSILQSISGLGLPSLCRQVRHFVPQAVPSRGQKRDESNGTSQSGEESLCSRTTSETGLERRASTMPGRANLGMLRYAGLLSQRPRSAVNLKHLLEDYFQLPFEVRQFHGNWLSLDETAQTRLGLRCGNSVLGENSVVGDQTWERQNKFLVQVGPLDLASFSKLMPDHLSRYIKNDFELLKDLIRLFAGPEMEFDIQMLVKGDEVPDPNLVEDSTDGLRLGWNTWLSESNRETSQKDPVSDTIFSVE